ncbi:translation initiation factor IF-2, putative [Trypanosoma equiperdum]|uniref:Translation initiation factor IF-2, putative n=1 Tax=Trypanosoma equiperdum TaxID=5694 RepID=A0A1G4I7H8_TRYEQ|nr:translation initiation factor IF-2, putative [Trypanosoma equiperdum]
MRHTRFFQKRPCNAFYSLPSVMDVTSFVGFVRSCTNRLANFCEEDFLARNSSARCKSFDCNTRGKVREDLAPLLNLREKEVERAVWEEYGLRNERLATCIVPYQIATNIILKRLPDYVRRESAMELKREELRISRDATGFGSNRFIQWVEKDVYVSTGIDYLKRLHPRTFTRVPVIAVMGHTQHGKTTFLDTLQETNLRGEESRGSTQCLRAFTVPYIEGRRPTVTLLDTPGERTFTETRLHAQNVADFIALVVSVVDGVGSQTYETIKVALNVDNPVVVVLNKMDLFSNARKAAEAVSKTLIDLRGAGLNVTLVRSHRDLERLRADQSATEVLTDACDGAANLLQLFAPMKTIDHTYRGSRKNPCVDLSRSCVGVCVSAKGDRNIDLFWSVVELMTSAFPPKCMSRAADYTSHCCSIQGVVLESSKHLFDEEGFRTKKGVQDIVKRKDMTSRKQQSRFERNSVSVRINSSVNAVRNKMNSNNPTSSNCLVLTVVVREGCITKGMPFIVDQSKGYVDYMVDAYGNFVDRALPGTAVTLVDAHSTSGCPGAGTHVLSIPSVGERDRIFGYRRLLQWFVECFPSKLHLLRPRGMDVSFPHLGDYGQLKDTTSLEYQLLYGHAPKTHSPQLEVSENAKEHLPSVSHLGVRSIAEYMLEKNAEGESDKGRLPSQTASHVGVMSDGSKLHVERMWSQLQLESQPQSQEAYDEFVNSCIQVGVVFKVDSWHSARMLHREASKLGTRRIVFQVVGMRFGELLVDDVLFFGRAMKIVVCYRTPIGASAELDQYIEANDTWVLQTDDVSDIVSFLKWCAVALHKEHAADEFGSLGGASGSSYMLLSKDTSKGGRNTINGEGRRRRQLLLTPST